MDPDTWGAINHSIFNRTAGRNLFFCEGINCKKLWAEMDFLGGISNQFGHSGFFDFKNGF